jgi:hypothetical protein
MNDKDTDYHEQRGQMALLREEIKELNEAMGGLLETSDYWRDGCLKLKGLSHKLKEKNHELRKQVDELIHMNQAISMVAGLPRKDEMETLIKDGKRMDWLLSHAYAIQVDEGEILSSRQKIDEAMKQPTQ